MYNENLKIEIRPVPNKSDIKKFSDNLEYFSKAKTIPCLVDPRTMKYATGLSEKDREYLEKNNFPYDISDAWVRDVPHPFWESQMAKVEMGNTPSFLYPGRNLLDFVKYKFLLASAFVYSSAEQMELGSKPEATHYIYNEGVEEETKAKKLQRRNERIQKVSSLSLARKRDLVMIIENEDVESKDENYLTIKFEEISDNEKKSAELDALLEASAEDTSMIAFIKSAIYNNVLKRTSKGIFYFETNLGYAEAEVKEFLNKPENQEILLTIKSKMNK